MADTTSAVNSTKQKTRITERRLLAATWSYKDLEGDGDGAAGLAAGLEVLALGEVEHPGQDRRRERLDLGVVVVHRVVVELPRIGDLVLGAREGLLEVQEVLVGLQVRVCLGQREHRL